MRIKFSGEFGSQEVAEHVAKYLSMFFAKYPVKSIKGLNVYFNMYGENGMVAPARDGEIIEIVEIIDPRKASKKKVKDNVVQMPVVEIIETTTQDLERKEQAKAEKRLQKMYDEFRQKYGGSRKGQIKVSKEDFEEKRRQNQLLKKKFDKSIE